METVSSVISYIPDGRMTSLLGIGNSLVTDIEVQILNTPLTG